MDNFFDDCFYYCLDNFWTMVWMIDAAGCRIVWMIIWKVVWTVIWMIGWAYWGIGCTIVWTIV